jgi:phytoene dehydrogenase-like protein
LGGSINLNSPVTELTHLHGRVNGVILDNGKIVEADIVVSNIDSQILYNKLIPNGVSRIRTWSERRAINRSTKSFSGFSLLLALNGKSNLNHHTVLFLMIQP